MSAELRSTSHGQTLVLTLSNPGLRNALDPAIYAAGIEALGSAERNAEVRSVVLTGEGGVSLGTVYLQLALFAKPDHTFALAALASAQEQAQRKDEEDDRPMV